MPKSIEASFAFLIGNFVLVSDQWFGTKSYLLEYTKFDRLWSGDTTNYCTLLKYVRQKIPYLVVKFNKEEEAYQGDSSSW